MFDDPSLIDEFLEEAQEHIERIEDGLLALETANDVQGAELVNDIFRGMHSIKGAAGMLGFDKLRDLAHVSETVLARVRAGELAPSARLVSSLLAALDKLKALVSDLSAEASVDIKPESEALEVFLQANDAPAAPEEAPADETPEAEAAEDAEPPEDAEEPDEAEEEPEAAAPAPEPEKKAASPAPAKNKKAPVSSKGSANSSETVRVPVWVLDRLMALAGELVLVRNRQRQHFDDRVRRDHNLATSVEGRLVQQLDLVTSDLQEAVLRTRMQPIGKVFSKLPRLCRDLGRNLGKEIVYASSGEDVEVDKTILECLSDPLVHLVRNSCDHGLETPDERRAAGKNPAGIVSISAFHDAGQIVIELRDDGKGIATDAVAKKAISQGLVRAEEVATMSEKQLCALIFAPGFSTAAHVTDVSGRGVGMDVVKTSIENIGGTIDVNSERGAGTTFTLRVPLTLAIVSSLLVKNDAQLFAIPQVNLEEVVRLHDEEVEERIEFINNQPIYRLRDTLLPLAYLRDILDHPKGLGNVSLPTVARPVCVESPASDGGEPTISRSLTFAVVRGSSSRFGIIVDEAVGSEEIVVKPNHPVLNDLRCFVGSTILGDGRVALILDVNGVAHHAALETRFDENAAREENAARASEHQRDLLFTIDGEDRYLMPLSLITRIIPIRAADIERFGSAWTVQLDGQNVRVVNIARHLGGTDYPSDAEELFLILPRHIRRPIGFLATQILEVHEADAPPDAEAHDHPAVLGSTIAQNKLALALDMFALARMDEPAWFTEAGEERRTGRVLFVEDTAFFRKTVGRYIEELGFDVTVAEDGREAVSILEADHASFDLLVSDLEMPNLDGFGLIKAIRTHPSLSRFHRIPALALSSLNSPEDRERAMSLGFDAYELKLDRATLESVLRNLLASRIAA